MKRLVIASILVVSPLFAHAGAWGEGSFENDDALDWVGHELSQLWAQARSTKWNEAIADLETRLGQ